MALSYDTYIELLMYWTNYKIIMALWGYEIKSQTLFNSSLVFPSLWSILSYTMLTVRHSVVQKRFLLNQWNHILPLCVLNHQNWEFIWSLESFLSLDFTFLEITCGSKKKKYAFLIVFRYKNGMNLNCRGPRLFK